MNIQFQAQWSRSGGARSSATCLLVAAITLAPVARGQGTEPTDAQKANARALGEAGVRAAMAGNCDEAIPKLTAAEKLFHAPSTAEQLGACLVKVGKVIAGTELLNRVKREPVGPSSPPSWAAAQGRAVQEYDEGVRKIGRLRIHVDGAAGTTDLVVKVDGETVEGALLDNDRLTDPGAHTVTAAATGFRSTSAQVTLPPGGSQAVSLSLERDPTYQPPVAPQAAGAQPASGTGTVVQTPPPSGAPAQAQSRSRVPAYVVLGAGGLGVVVGSVFGVLALSTKSTLDSHCTNKVCPGGEQSDIDALHLNAVVSTVGFGVGVVGLAVGTYLLVSTKESSPPATASVAVRPWVGPTGAGLVGVFR
jgi:hypothetical protein